MTKQCPTPDAQSVLPKLELSDSANAAASGSTSGTTASTPSATPDESARATTVVANDDENSMVVELTLAEALRIWRELDDNRMRGILGQAIFVACGLFPDKLRLEGEE